MKLWKRQALTVSPTRKIRPGKKKKRTPFLADTHPSSQDPSIPLGASLEPPKEDHGGTGWQILQVYLAQALSSLSWPAQLLNEITSIPAAFSIFQERLSPLEGPIKPDHEGFVNCATFSTAFQCFPTMIPPPLCPCIKHVSSMHPGNTQGTQL